MFKTAFTITLVSLALASTSVTVAFSSPKARPPGLAQKTTVASLRGSPNAIRSANRCPKISLRANHRLAILQPGTA